MILNLWLDLMSLIWGEFIVSSWGLTWYSWLRHMVRDFFGGLIGHVELGDT